MHPDVIDAKVTVDGKRAVKSMRDWQLSDNAAYLHYCPNETIDGIAIEETPDFGKDVIVAADFSSTILSAPNRREPLRRYLRWCAEKHRPGRLNAGYRA
ncbi:hypothetical protein ACLK1Y_05035 [Escherichia coli]